MDERMRFVLECERSRECMAVLCRMFGISRKTGYKWLRRYLEEGPSGLEDRSRAPLRHPLKVAEEVEEAVIEARGQHPTWGAPKLRAWLMRKYRNRYWPAASTVGAILKRYGLTVHKRRRRRMPPYTQPFVECTGPNALWCGDYKGWFRTGDGRRCEPLTISDAYSRYLIRCQAVRRTTYEIAKPIFEAAFIENGMPWAIRTDNGPPFASQAVAGLSRLSLWWVKLGIKPERIDPGKPEQNGRHERIHLTMEQEATRCPEETAPKQQDALDRFRYTYNYERPHEALGQQTPAEHYEPSPRTYPLRTPEMVYEAGITVRRVRSNGELKWRGSTLFLSEVLVGEPVGLEQLDDRYWRIRFGPVELAWLDDYQHRITSPPLSSLLEDET